MVHVTKAVDKVRKQEHRQLMAEGNTTLKGSKYMWLYNKENIPEHRRQEFARLRTETLKVGRAWAINVRVGREFIRHLKERGLCTDAGILCIIEGSKGFCKSIREELAGESIIQRCQYHKRENVVSYLPKEIQDEFRKKLQAAYQKETYIDAKNTLETVRKELGLINESAVRSLDEGLEETLTLHRLGLFKQLGRNFKTTNAMESVLLRVETKVSKVDNWKNSNQKQRWLATVLLDTEPRLNRINGYRYLKLLRQAIQKELKINIEQKALSA